MSLSLPWLGAVSRTAVQVDAVLLLPSTTKPHWSPTLICLRERLKQQQMCSRRSFSEHPVLQQRT